MVQFELLSSSKVHFWLTCNFCTGGLTLSSSTLQNDVEFIVKSMTLSPQFLRQKKWNPKLTDFSQTSQVVSWKAIFRLRLTCPRLLFPNNSFICLSRAHLTLCPLTKVVPLQCSLWTAKAFSWHTLHISHACFLWLTKYAFWHPQFEELPPDLLIKFVSSWRLFFVSNSLL